MQLRQPIRDLLLAVWTCEPGRIAAELPEGLAPLTAGGRAVVALAAFRNRPARLGLLPVPPYAEIDVRTFVVDRDGSSAVFVFDFYVPAVGLAASPFGVPVHLARINVSRGTVGASGIGVAARYTVAGPAVPGDLDTALATHPAAYWVKNRRLLRMDGGHHGAAWHEAELGAGARFEPAARFDLDPARPDRALYAERAALRATLPARRA